MSSTNSNLTDTDKFNLSGLLLVLGLFGMVLGVAFTTVAETGGLIAAGVAFLIFCVGAYGMGRYFGL